MELLVEICKRNSRNRCIIYSMRVAIVSGLAKKADSLRGIGAHNSSLFEAFRQAKNGNIIDPNLSPNDDFSKFDAVHFTSFRPFFISLPYHKPKGVKYILTIHDLIPLLYPDHYKPGVKGKIKYIINKFLIKKKVDAIITISETSKKDICRILGVKPEIVHVVYLAPKYTIKKLESGSWTEEIKQRLNLPEKFILFDHGLNYNKNVPILIRACRAAKIPLAIVGKEIENIDSLDLNHPELSHLKGVNFDDVIKLGYLSDEDLNKVFNLAHLVVQPSLYEGFGMPPVEAMSVGCPVISSRTQALVEICGDACLYFDPKNLEELVNAIKILSNNSKLRKEYIQKGYDQVKKYSWKKAADETLKVYEKIIET